MSARTSGESDRQGSSDRQASAQTDRRQQPPGSEPFAYRNSTSIRFLLHAILSMDRLRRDAAFIALMNKVMLHLQVSWRQTLLSSLEACGFDSVDSVPGSARTDDMPFSYMGESCTTEREAHESAACDIFIALLLATPRSVKMVHSCFEAVSYTHLTLPTNREV